MQHKISFHLDQMHPHPSGHSWLPVKLRKLHHKNSHKNDTVPGEQQKGSRTDLHTQNCEKSTAVQKFLLKNNLQSFLLLLPFYMQILIIW